MKKKELICFRCHKIIKPKSNYYAFTEWNKEKVVNVSYAHRKCWDDFLNQLSNTDEAMGIVRALSSKLVGMGILPPKVVKV